MKRLIIVLGIVLSFSGGVLPNIAFAQDSGTVSDLVPCGRADDPAKSHECGFSDLVVMIQKIIRFVIFYIIIPLVTLVIFYYGVMMLIVQDKPAQLTALKQALWKVVVGLFFMLTAWLIVEAIVTFFGVELQDAESVENGAVTSPIKLLNFD